jgi:nicotinamidase-related amidase
MKQPAVIIVDMIKDNVDVGSPFGIGEEGRRIIPNLQHLLATSREAGFPIIFANDSFMLDDFIFQGRMKPHAIRGSEGVKVIAELEPQPSDIVLEKRRFSAFFKTDLDMTLRGLGIDTIVVAGIATQVCVLLTALDGIANDFKVIILEDCCASFKKSMHDAVLDLYGKAFSPLLQVMSSDEFLSAYGV